MAKYESTIDRWNRQALEKAKLDAMPKSQFRGTTLVPGAEIAAENTQRRSLETLAAKGEQDRLSQDNAGDIAQSRQDRMDVDVINARQEGPSMAEQRKEFMDRFAAHRKPQLDPVTGLPATDVEGNPIQPMGTSDILNLMREEDEAFKSRNSEGPVSKTGLLSGQGYATTEKIGYSASGKKIDPLELKALKATKDSPGLKSVPVGKDEARGGTITRPMPQENNALSTFNNVGNNLRKPIIAPGAEGFGAGISAGRANKTFPGITPFKRDDFSTYKKGAEKRVFNLRQSLYNN